MNKAARVFLFIGLIIVVFTVCTNRGTQKDYPFQPVNFTDVHITDQFWAPRMETNQKITIPYAFQQCVETGRIKNFEEAASVRSGQAETGEFCSVYPFDDSDVFKIIEGASYSLRMNPDPELDQYLDDLIAKIAAAQEEDGYLYSARTVNSESPVRWVEEERWANMYMGHELYNVGHMYEAAVAHYLATGKRTLLDVALKNADLIDSVFGPGKKHGAPGHQEIEIGLVKLYRVTGDQRYLNLAKFFLDERGNSEDRKLFGEYSQDHKPVIEQTEAVGHAVRAAYMYSGMADVAALTGDSSYVQAIERIWEDVVFGKLYLTGGIGATGSGEAFGGDYNLPNATAYAETCAAIGNALWNQRMFLLNGDAKYADVLERVLYNGLISGVALSGDLFFYPNPLESFGQHKRSPWFACACCPGNISRFMPSVPGYVYALREDVLYVNLFVDSNVQVKLKGQDIQIDQETEYPWDGKIKIKVNPDSPARFAVYVRIPGWAQNQPVPSDLYRYMNPASNEVILKVNGEEADLYLEKGYARIRRRWKKGDTVELGLPMPVRRVLSHPELKENAGKAALERGPIVYCAEWPDNQGSVSNLVLPDESELAVERRDDMFDGVVVIKGQALALHEGQDENSSEKKQQEFTAIPYYAWAHRGQGEMAVWLPRTESLARALPKTTIASTSKVSASRDKNGAPVNDQWEPKHSNDHAHPYLHWWPAKGTVEWVQYDFKKAQTVSEVKVYWFDDTGRGECRVPVSWKILYKKGSEWIPVINKEEHGVSKDMYNRVTFTPVRTSALRLEIQLQEKFSAGIHEWKVK
ncbi:MAG: glycoside hydrolase family 127 protein [Candidatus Aminicenantes bacterium]